MNDTFRVIHYPPSIGSHLITAIILLANGHERRMYFKSLHGSLEKYISVDKKGVVVGFRNLTHKY